MESTEKIVEIVDKSTVGELEYIGRKPLGYIQLEYYKCKDCGTEFPSTPRSCEEGAKAMCNNTPINVCPWCRPDSKPFTKGRGL